MYSKNSKDFIAAAAMVICSLGAAQGLDAPSFEYARPIPRAAVVERMDTGKLKDAAGKVIANGSKIKDEAADAIKGFTSAKAQYDALVASHVGPLGFLDKAKYVAIAYSGTVIKTGKAAWENVIQPVMSVYA